MNSRYKVIAYATRDDYYQNLSKSLESSCNSLDIPLYLESMDSLGSWELNTHYKAKFIKKCMLMLDTEYLLYIDVDAVFRRYPILFDSLNCDIAYRTENFKWRKDEALSGTIFIKNKNDYVTSFVDKWIELNDRSPAQRMKPETWEQSNMKKVVREFVNLDYYNLPPEYTFIFDHSKTLYPNINPVILHGQASRQVFKNKR